MAWSPSSIWELLRRPIYRGEVVCNRTRKRDSRGRKHQQPRDPSEWIRQDRPDLRIVPEGLWQATHGRLEGARDDYARRTSGRGLGRPVNGTESKYLLTGLAQCGWCNGGLTVQSREHGKHRRGFFYACTGYHLRGRTICQNRQYLPMDMVNTPVLERARDVLLNPRVLERALTKLGTRLAEPSDDARVNQLETQLAQLQAEVERLTTALAAGGTLMSLVAAIRDRESRLEIVRAELEQARAEAVVPDVPVGVVMAEVRVRLRDWRAILAEESTQARQMLKLLLRGRLVFTPDLEQNECEMSGDGDPSVVFQGLLNVPKALASPTGVVPEWSRQIPGEVPAVGRSGKAA